MLLYLFTTFLRIGSLSFGGYMSLISMVRSELVEKSNLINDKLITEGIALASILPGPLAVNVVAMIGYKLKGGWGALVSTIAVLIPSFILVIFLSFLYFSYNTILDFNIIFVGVIPVVISIIISVGISMAQKNAKSLYQLALIIFTISIQFIVRSYWVIILLIFMGILCEIIFKKIKINRLSFSIQNWAGLLWFAVLFAIILLLSLITESNSLFNLFIVFAKLSLTLFGGGYVMIPLLEVELVNTLRWMTHSEFALGISLGQLTPGPILISSVFFGYKMHYFLGAIVATLGIFLPSSLLMIFISKFYFTLPSNNSIHKAVGGLYPIIVGLILFSAINMFIDHIKTHNVYIALLIIFTSLMLIMKFNKSIHVALLAGLAISCLKSFIL